MEILVESISASEGNIITESKSDGKNMWLHGIFMQADIKNRNGRVYPLSEMATAISTATQQIKEYGGIFGELDHPSGLSVSCDRISHAITELYMNGSNVMGKAKLLNTPMGLIAQELAKSGVRYGVSSRGAGQVNESGEVSSFAFLTCDIVATPSASGAYPSTIVEMLDSTKAGNKVMSLAESVQHDKDAQEFFKKSILEFMASISRK